MRKPERAPAWLQMFFLVFFFLGWLLKHKLELCDLGLPEAGEVKYRLQLLV